MKQRLVKVSKLLRGYNTIILRITFKHSPETRRLVF